MAYPTIPTAAAGRLLHAVQADATSPRTFPDLGSLTKNNGDLLVAIIVCYQSSLTSAIFSSWGAGFTEIRDIGVASNMCIGVAYKISDGTETGTFTVAQAGTITGHAAMFLLSIPGAHPSAAPEVSAALANGTAAAADPAALAPSWGSAETLWIAVGASGETSTSGTYTGVTADPTNYTNSDDSGISADAVGGVDAHVAFRQNTTASEDVGPFTLDLSNTRNVAFVIAVRPSLLQSLTVPLLDGAPALYAPTVQPDQFLTVPLLDGAPALYAPDIAPAPVAITLPYLDSPEALYAPTVADASGGGAAPAVVDSSSVATVTTSQPTLVVPVPAGTVDGNVMFMVVYITATAGSVTTPGGWNVVYSNTVAGSSTSSHAALFWRVASSEPASYTVTVTNGRASGGIISLSGVDTTTPVDVSSANPDTTQGLSVVGTSISPAAATLLLGFFGGRILPNGTAGAWTPPGTMTEQEDISSAIAATSNSMMEIATEDVAAGATGDRTATATTVTSVNWIAYLVAVKPAAGAPAAKTITLALLDATPSLYSPTVTPAPVTLTIAQLDGAPALYAPSLTPTNTLSPALLDGAPTLYAPTLARYNTLTLGLLDGAPSLFALTVKATNTLTLGLLDSSPALYAPTFVVGPVALTLPLLDAGATLYAPSVAPVGGPSQTLTLGLLDGVPSLYALTLTGKNTVTLSLLNAGAALYAPQVLPAQFLTLGLLDAGPALYAPTLQGAPLGLTLPLLDSPSNLYAPSLSVGPVTATLPLLDGAPTLYAPQVKATNTLQPPLLDSGAALYPPQVQPDQFVTLSLLDGTPTLYPPVVLVMGGPQTLLVPLLDGAPTLYPLQVLPQPRTLTLGYLDSNAALYAPTIIPGPVTIVLSQLNAGPTLFSPTLWTQTYLTLPHLSGNPTLYPPVINAAAVTVGLALLDSGAALYPPVVAFSVVSYPTGTAVLGEAKEGTLVVIGQAGTAEGAIGGGTINGSGPGGSATKAAPTGSARIP